jgi:hypothetical protein
MTQVFFSKDLKKSCWRVVLQKEDLFITTTIDPSGLNASMGLPPPPTTVSLIGVIELLDKDNLLACAKF